MLVFGFGCGLVGLFVLRKSSFGEVDVDRKKLALKSSSPRWSSLSSSCVTAGLSFGPL